MILTLGTTVKPLLLQELHIILLKVSNKEADPRKGRKIERKNESKKEREKERKKERNREKTCQ
jgi:hypothetical protein